MRAKQESLVQPDQVPFLFPMGPRAGGGIHCEVRKLGEDRFVKTVRRIWQRGEWERNLIEDYYLQKEFLRSFIPPTSFVEGRNERGRRDLFVVQKRIEGKPLKAYSYEDLMKSQKAREELNEFTIEAHTMYQWTGRIPDLHGEPLFSQYDIKATKNVMIEPSGKIWLVDVEMLGPFWSPRWVGGRLHMQRMVEALSHFRQRLQLDLLEEANV